MNIDFSKLLGFENASEVLPEVVDFRDQTVGDKLGAKIGLPEDISPAKGIDFRDETFGARVGAKVSSEST
jgi:hypothetical protein